MCRRRKKPPTAETIGDTIVCKQSTAEDSLP